MKQFIVFFLLLTQAIPALCQEAQDTRHGTLKIEKKNQLSRIHFDDVNYRLIGIDRSGNVLDSAVVSFEMNVIIKGISYSEKTVGPGLSYKMQQLLGRCDRTTKITFTNIEAKDRYGTIIRMPVVHYTFGYSDEDND